MAGIPPEPQTTDTEPLSLVRGDAAWRLQRAIGLIPADGLGIGRRAIGLALFTWLPIAIWAWYHQSISGIRTAEPLLTHFGVHTRLLIAIPLMVVAEGMVHSIMPRLVPYFLSSGVLPPSESGRFREILRGMLRLRDSTLPWIFILGGAIALSVGTPAMASTHEMDWARDPGTSGLGFGGDWFRFVGRPLFIAMLIGWMWRLILFGLLLRRISRLPLSLVPSHPDGNGGLGFLELFPTMFAPIVFLLSAVMASHWSHQILYHGAKLLDLRLSMVTFVVVLLVLFLGPFFVFMRPLMMAKRLAELEYGALVGRHGRMVRQKWIESLEVSDAQGLLGAPELGPVADHITMFQTVDRMRSLPIGKRALVSVLVPAAIPLLVVVSLQIPIKDLLLGLVKAIA